MIAFDAMGGDFAPRAAVQGAIFASQRNIAVQLFGDENKIIPLLYQLCPEWTLLPLEVVHCPDQIDMGEEPSKSVLKSKNSSLVRAVQAVADGRAKAVVSAGNSGAALVAGALILKRAPHIIRPAIGDFLPTNKGSIFCIDLGANADCKPSYLEQFAQMGHVYVQMVKNIESPRIALLSNGSEPFKGSVLVKESYSLLEKSNLNFIGNVESRDIFHCDADVLVCDGFVGNVLLKALQGTTKALLYWLHKEAMSSWLQKIYFYLGSSIFKKIKDKVDYSKRGGALLLGLEYPFVIAHGCSNSDAFLQALIFADQIEKEKFIPLFNEQVAALAEKKSGVSMVVSQRLKSIFGFRQQ